MTQASPLFRIDDERELLALWRLVAEAKFSMHPEDADIWGSPFVNDISQRVSDALLLTGAGDPEATSRHMRWIQSLPTNAALPAIRARLREDARNQWWRRQSTEEKLSYVRRCIAPFQAPESFLTTLISDAED